MRRGGEHFALILFDVDHFKLVNDTYGHDAGDKVLISVAELLRRNTRDNLEILGRVGGEEFAVLCLGKSDAAAACLIAERLRQAVATQTIELPAGRLTVTVSAGLARPEAPDESWESVYARADHALYRAKESGRNRVCSADDA